MTIIDRVRTTAANRLTQRANSLLGTADSNLIQRAAGALTSAFDKGDAGQNTLFGKALAAVNANQVLGGSVGKLVGDIGKQFGTSPVAAAGAKRIEDQFDRQRAGLSAAKAPGLPGVGQLPAAAAPVQLPAAPGTAKPAASKAPPPAKWTAAPLWGSLTPKEYRELFLQSAMTAHSWKNLFYVSITDRKHSAEAPKGIKQLNLLAMDVSFGPCTMAGEAVAIGSANMDHLTGSERTDLRLTTLDDDRGSITRWFTAKCDQAAHTDGTFGLPADYLVTVDITQMAPTNKGTDKQRMRFKFLMRPVAIEKELSRRSGELEEIQLTFTQFDTFMVPK